MKKFIAIGSVGHFMPGEEIKGLDAERIQALLASGAIEEFQESQTPQDDNSAEIIAELKAKVAELEKALSDSQAALKKATAEAKKATTPAEK